MMMVFLFFGYYYLQKHVNNRFRQKFDWAISEINPYAALDYEKVHVNFIGSKIKIEGICLMPVDTNEKIRIDELVINKCDLENNIPVRTHFEIKGVHFTSDKNLLKKAMPYLFQMGYNDIIANFELAYTFDSRRSEFDIHNLTIEASDMGKLKLMLNFKGFDVTKILSGIDNISDLATVFFQISIDAAEIRYNDYSFLKKLVQSRENQSIQPYMFFIHEAARGIDHAIEKEESLPTKSALMSLRDFMTDPDKINIVAKPDQPVPLSRFIWVKSLKDIIEILHIKIVI